MTYIERVENDGGTVGDKPYTNSWIKALKDEGVFDTLLFSYGAEYGYQLASGAVSKWYGINAGLTACDAVQATAALRPAYTANTINTRPALVFTESAAQRLRASLPTTVNTASATFYVVANRNTDADDIAQLFGFTSTATANNPDSRLGVSWNGASSMRMSIGDGTTNKTLTFSSTEIAVTGAQVFRVLVQVTGGVVEGTLGAHTGTVSKATILTTGTTADDLIMGGTGGDDPVASRSFGGYICEIHGFSGVHSAATQTLISNYLHYRYFEDPAGWDDVAQGGVYYYMPVFGTSPAPDAPTGGVVNDTANTFAFTPNPHFTISQHEYSLNNGGSWATCAASTITVGDNNVGAGSLRVRVKSINGMAAGATLTNATAFTSTTTTSGVEAKPVPDPATLTWEYGVVPVDSQRVGTTLTLKNRNFRSNTGAVMLDLRSLSNGSTVVIEDCCFYGGGIAIWAEYRRLRVTIKNCFFFNTSYTDSTDWGNWAFTGTNQYKLVFENNYVEGRGVQLEFTSPAAGLEGEGFTIRYNKFKNIHGNPNSIIQGGNAFNIQGNDANIAGILFEWNEIKNEEGLTHVEDNVNLFRVGGTTASPMTLRHNFVRGAYAKTVNGEYSGGGFIVEMAVDPANLPVPADPNSWNTNWECHDNIVVHVKNYCIGVASGNNINIYNNLCLVAGMHTKAATYGVYFNSWSSGIWSSFYYNGGGGRNVNIFNNEIGVRNTGGTQSTTDDYHQEIGVSDGSAVAYNNTLWENLGKYPTLSDEDAAEAEWNAKLTANNRVLGPVQQSVNVGILLHETFEGATAFSGQQIQKSTTYGFTLVPSPTNPANKVGRFELRDTDPEASGGTRVEVLFPSSSKRVEAWYKWETYYPSNGDFAIDSSSDVIAQWWQVSGSTQATSLRIRNDEILLRTGNISTDLQEIVLGPVIRDTWDKLVFHFIHSYGSDGLIEVWRNGTKILTHTGGNMYDTVLPAWKIGVYKAGWNTGTTDTTKRIFYMDNLKHGDSFATLSSMS